MERRSPERETSSVPADVPAEEMYCPRCGYNVRGIPEDRCPECGFGFQRAAIRSLAIANFDCRLTNYQRTVLYAAISLACSVVGAASLLDVHYFALLLRIGGGALGFAVFHSLTSDGSIFPSIWRILVGVAMILVVVVVGFFFPVAFCIAAAVALLVPLILFQRLPKELREARLSQPDRAERRLTRWWIAGWVATLVALVALIWVAAKFV